MTDVMPVLDVRGLEKHFGGVVAARDINVTVGAGEQIAIVGSNGAGKTTFVNMVTGYLKPSGGTIRFRGQDVTGLDPRQTHRSRRIEKAQHPDRGVHHEPQAVLGKGLGAPLKRAVDRLARQAEVGGYVGDTVADRRRDDGAVNLRRGAVEHFVHPDVEGVATAVTIFMRIIDTRGNRGGAAAGDKCRKKGKGGYALGGLADHRLLPEEHGLPEGSARARIAGQG